MKHNLLISLLPTLLNNRESAETVDIGFQHRYLCTTRRSVFLTTNNARAFDEFPEQLRKAELSSKMKKHIAAEAMWSPVAESGLCNC